jgi:signal transduction histidine kinase
MKKMFNKARIKLAIVYLLLIMLISLFFSFNIYVIMSRELDRKPRRVPNQEIMVKEIKEVVVRKLLITNIWILIISGGLGYCLAGLTLKPIQIAMEDQKRFISDASHELRTPLTVIKTETEVSLRDKKLNLKNAKKQLVSNLEEAEKLKKLTDYLLCMGKNKRLEEIDLSEVAKIVVNNFKYKINLDVKKVNIVFNKVAMEELLTILLDNAGKYSSKGGQITLSISSSLVGIDSFFKEKRLKTIIEVKDEGIGIRKSDLPHIFNRFYRVDGSRTKNKVEGYGLGLAIAKNIVDTYKGKIEVESEVGKGSVFRVIV